MGNRLGYQHGFGSRRPVAQRATVGIARVGGTGHNGSRDIFLAFATGNHIPAGQIDGLSDLKMLPHEHIDPLFDAMADVVEESILNALALAETMIGFQGRTAYEIPFDEFARVMDRYRPKG